MLAPTGGFTSSLGVLEQSCGVCLRAKQTRDTFSLSNIKTVKPFYLIQCDLFGPYREPSTSGAWYFLTIVDDCSRAVWKVLLLEKKEAPGALKTFCSFVYRQFRKHIKIIRTDNGSELLICENYLLTEALFIRPLV